MVITLISQEKNLGILTLTDYLIENLGRSNIYLCGWNYLNSNEIEKMALIKKFCDSRTVIVKYIIPKVRFSNQGFNIPESLKEISTILFKVPTYLEERAQVVPLNFLKGENCPVTSHIKKFYA